MKVFRTAAEVRAWRAGSGQVGIVPTMGALHAGHASLIDRAARECEAAAVSVFVNPTQFGPGEDLAKYPRSEQADVALCERLGAAMVFTPSVEEMYPPGEVTRVQPGPIAEPLEGKARPGHFIGVATVVAKLLAIVRPDAAYFGQKDFQQLRVIQTMTRDLGFGTRIVGCPTVREPDGLAWSSRNAYLSPEERQRAVALSRGMFAARDLWDEGVREPDRLRSTVLRQVNEPGISVEYVSVADPYTLAELRGPADEMVISLAARVGTTRLIDNVLLGIDVGALR